MKCFALISLVGVALGAPAPEDAAAPVVLPYGYGLGAYPYALPYAGLPLAYNALHTGLVYPVHNYYNINSCPIAILGTIFNHSATLGNILNHRGWSNEAQVASRAPPTLG